MKKSRILTFLCLFFVVICARAEYAAMEIKTTDGESHYVRACGLVITTTENELIASDSEKVLLTLKLTTVASMELVGYFASVNDFEKPVEGVVEVFTLDGKTGGRYESLNDARSQLGTGVYIIKTATGQTFKLSIGK